MAEAVDEKDDDGAEERRQRREEIVGIVEEKPGVLGIEEDKKLLRLAVDGRRVGDTEALEVLT